MCNKYWAHALEHGSLCTAITEAQGLRAWALQQEKTLQWETRTLQPESTPLSAQENAHMQQGRPNAAKNKINKYICIS